MFGGRCTCRRRRRGWDGDGWRRCLPTTEMWRWSAGRSRQSTPRARGRMLCRTGEAPHPQAAPRAVAVAAARSAGAGGRAAPLRRRGPAPCTPRPEKRCLESYQALRCDGVWVLAAQPAHFAKWAAAMRSGCRSSAGGLRRWVRLSQAGLWLSAVSFSLFKQLKRNCDRAHAHFCYPR